MSVSATVKMYNQQNLGDCFLLDFSDGDQQSWIMIDFGSYQSGNQAREAVIAKDILDKVGTQDLVMVLTHQHKDHLSGFDSASEILAGLKVPELWLSFLDDPNSPAGQAIRDVSEKYWNKNGQINTLAAKKGAKSKAVKAMLDAKKGLDLFAEQQQGGQAVSNLLEWAKKPRFLKPGDHFDLKGMEGKVHVYVLGPPTDFNMLKSMNPKNGEAVDGLAAINEFGAASDFMLGALSRSTSHGFKTDFPFAQKYVSRMPAPARVSPKQNGKKTPGALYQQPDQNWRRIDYDWLNSIGRLALHMDNLTNNTSLVLAFELVETGKVLLFVGDAQIGNWKSWFDVKFKGSDVTAEDLLSRTVLYKAGHHSSHNATLSKGLELMNEKELMIMIPLNEKISTKYGFAMGKKDMLLGYNRKAHGRIVRTDTIYQNKPIKGSKYKFISSGPAGLKVVKKNKTDKDQLYIEYTVR